MCKNSSEYGFNNGLGWLDINIEKLNDEKNRIPHVGWNKIKIIKKKIFLINLQMINICISTTRLRQNIIYRAISIQT